MLKRANKITTLIVAAASIVSMVPAMAADTATTVTKMETKDGTIQNAVAFKDGKYIYQGYKSDTDDNGVYYSAAGKDKILSGLQDADFVDAQLNDSDHEGFNGTYEDKYAYFLDGDDEYLVDLTSGTVIDSDTPDEDMDNTQVKLRSNLKKADRFGSIDDSAFTALSGKNTTLYKIPNTNSLADEWYMYKVTPKSDDAATNIVGGYLYGFTNKNGKYIDICNTANIYAYSSKKEKSVKIDEFSNKAGDADDESGLLATLVGEPEVLAQDKDYIYTKIKVQIYDENAKAGEIKVTTAAAVATGVTDSSKVVERTYVQKISKAQGDTKDDAYLPKTVESYEIAKSGEFDASSADDAATALNKSGLVYSVVNGQLLAVDHSDSEKLKVTTLNFKKDKVEFETKYKPTSFTRDKVDVYLVEEDDHDDVDVESGNYSYDFDVNGNVWAIDKGKIYEFKNNQFNKVFACDNSMDAINVYDEKNLIAWEEDGDIYATVGGASAAATTPAKTTPTTPATTPAKTTPTTPAVVPAKTTPTTPATTPAPAAKTGWVKLADGTWNYYEKTGAKAASKWVNDGGTWYYLKADGAMATGWFKDTDGKWYFLKSSGAMAANEVTPDGYYVNASGVWVQ
jgi:roadblock/LC7 domain-containing protein/phage pi2 protein 07